MGARAQRELTEISEPALGHMQELGVILHPVLRLVQLQNQWPPRHDPFKIKTHNPKLTMNTTVRKFESPGSDGTFTAIPEPRGRKSRPTMLSSTDDFPELCTYERNRAQKHQTKCVSLIKARSENPRRGEQRPRGDRREESYLASYDGDGRERLPEGGEGGGGAFSAVVPEHGAGALDAVHEHDHVLHGLHGRGSGRRKRATKDGRF